MLAAKERDTYHYIHPFNCEICGAPGAARSHRKNFFEFLRTRFSGKVPFRCNRCKRRFWLAIDPRDI